MVRTAPGETAFDPLASDSLLIAYVDYKSPYAFVALEPTYQLEEELGIDVDWRPLTLDIPSYLGSARLDAQGNVIEEDRTPEQWAAVRYAYRDARRYAVLNGLTLRGTVKIWDTSLAHIGMLWAKRQGRDILRAYNAAVTLPFWRRQLDLEDAQVITSVLERAGAETAGFEAFLAGEGRQQHDTMQTAIFDAGIFGVPSYVVGGELFFGREHLPRIRWLLDGRRGPAPDVAYRGFGAPARSTVSRREARRPARVVVAIDFKQPQSYLAWEPTLDLARDLGVGIDWRPFTTPPLSRPSPPATNDDRGTRHRGFRARYVEHDLRRYAESRGLTLGDLHRGTDSSLAGMGLLWLEGQHDRRDRRQVHDYLRLVFDGFWKETLDIEQPAEIRGVLEAVGADAGQFDPLAMREDHDRCQAQLRDAGVIGAPAYIVGDEVFLGRQHLPMIRWLLEGKRGPPPI